MSPKIRSYVAKKRKMGFDMGSKNTSYGVIARKGKSVRFIVTGMIQKPISDLTKPFFDQAFDFEKELVSLIEKYRPDELMAERFLTRGIKGKNIECISIMLGIMASVCRRYGIGFRLVTPAAWKNSCNRKINKRLDNIYLAVKRKNSHAVDGILIAYYARFPKFNFLRYGKAIKAFNRLLEAA